MKGCVLTTGWCLPLLALFLLLCACGPQLGGYPYSVLNTPEQRAFNGFSFLRQERLSDAQREFEEALLLEPKSSAALRGIGLVYGMKKDFGRAFEAMAMAGAYAENLEDRARAEVGMMSLYAMEKSEGWLLRVESGFQKALSLSGELPEAYLELGLAYKHAYRSRDAEEAFQKVLKLNTTLLNEAREEIDLLKKIEKAAPRSTIGKELALARRITRAETAAILIHESAIERILGSPSKQAAGARDKATGPPPDVLNHRFKEEILLALKLNIKGLGVLHDGSYGADTLVTRAVFAGVMADVLVRGSGQAELASRYARSPSPFLDVRNTSSHFTAIMICFDWAGIMAGWAGYFHPMETISGVDALLTLRGAESKLKGN